MLVAALALPLVAPRVAAPPRPAPAAGALDDIARSGAIEHLPFSPLLLSRPADTVIADTDTTLDSIAAAHGTAVGGLRWANGLGEGSRPAAGDALLIPPAEGALVKVQPGERPTDFAARLGLDPRVILDYNSLTTDSPLAAGRYLQVPSQGAPAGALPSSAVVPTADGIPAVASSQASHGRNGFPYGQCTWYAASRRNVMWGGDAGTWWDAARGIRPEGHVPVRGALVVMENPPVGHVAYVERVFPDDSFVISEMNYYGAPGGGLGRVDRRTIRAGPGSFIAGFIY